MWGDKFENDPDGAWITWGAGTGLHEGWGADITPPSQATVRENPAESQEGTKYLEIYLADTSSDPEIGSRYSLIQSPLEKYISLLNPNAIYVSWWVKLLQYFPASWGKIFYMGRYTGSSLQRMCINMSAGSGAIGFGELYINGEQRASRSTPAVLPLNEWHKLAIALLEDPIVGYYKAWMDDAPILDVSGINNVPPSGMGYRLFEIGWYYPGNNVAPANLYMHLDDIQVGNYLTEEPPQHTLTVNSEGLLGVPFEVRRIA